MRLTFPIVIPTEQLWAVVCDALAAAGVVFAPRDPQPLLRLGETQRWGDEARCFRVRSGAYVFDREPWSVYSDAYDHRYETRQWWRALLVGFPGRVVLLVRGDEEGWQWLHAHGAAPSCRAAVTAWLTAANAAWRSRSRWRRHPSAPRGWQRGVQRLDVWQPSDERVFEGDAHPASYRWQRGDRWWAVSEPDREQWRHFVGPVSGPALRRICAVGNGEARLPGVATWLEAVAPGAASPALAEAGSRDSDSTVGLLDTRSFGREEWQRWTSGPWVVRVVQTGCHGDRLPAAGSPQSVLVQSTVAGDPAVLGVVRWPERHEQRLELALFGTEAEVDAIAERLVAPLRAHGWRPATGIVRRPA